MGLQVAGEYYYDGRQAPGAGTVNVTLALVHTGSMEADLQISVKYYSGTP